MGRMKDLAIERMNAEKLPLVFEDLDQMVAYFMLVAKVSGHPIKKIEVELKENWGIDHILKVTETDGGYRPKR